MITRFSTSDQHEFSKTGISYLSECSDCVRITCEISVIFWVEIIGMYTLCVDPKCDMVPEISFTVKISEVHNVYETSKYAI